MGENLASTMLNSHNFKMQNRYSFTAQDVFTLPASTDKCFAAPDKLFVSDLTKLVLTVHNLAERGVVTHTLKTKSVVQRVEYCQVKNHIATIEDDILYVYQSWWSELKLKVIGCAKCFSWCQTSGRLAVFDGSSVTVFEDLVPLFQVHGLADVSEVQLCDRILAVTTSSFVVVLALNEEKYKTDNDEEIIWNFECPDLIINGQSLVSLPKREKGLCQAQIPDHLEEAYLPSAPIHGLNLEVKNLCNHSTYQAKVILFQKGQPAFMRLVPYVNRPNELNQDPLSPEKGELEYVTLFLADATSCELFSVFGPEFRSKLELLVKAKSFAVDECFMHVLTQSSLLSYSIPVPGLSNNWDPILLSSHLMNMESLLMCRDHVVVLSSRDMDEVTVYALLKPTTSEFFDDLVSLEDESIRARAEDVVRLQVRMYGEACSEKLRALCRSIDVKSSSPVRMNSLFESDPQNGELSSEALNEADVRLMLNEEGFFSELGNQLVSKSPTMLPLLLKKCGYISPKVLKEQIALANPATALAICDYVCTHLQRVEAAKLHRKMLTKSIPQWVYELPPFNGHDPDADCSNEDNCLCLRCCGGILYGVVVLANAPRDIRHEHLLQRVPDHVPDVLKFACLIPLTRSSSAEPANFERVAKRIVALAQKYTQKLQPEAPHLLTVLSDVLSLTDFLQCVPEASLTVLPWVQNGLMRERARKLKLEIVSFGSELRPLLP